MTSGQGGNRRAGPTGRRAGMRRRLPARSTPATPPRRRPRRRPTAVPPRDGAAADGPGRPRCLPRLDGARRVSAVVTLLNWRHPRLGRPVSAQARRRRERRDAADFAEQVVRIGIVGGLVFIPVYGMFVWFAWQGRNWARIVLWVLGGLGDRVRAARAAGRRLPAAVPHRPERVPVAAAVAAAVVFSRSSRPTTGTATGPGSGPPARADPGRRPSAAGAAGAPTRTSSARRRLVRRRSRARAAAATPG